MPEERPQDGPESHAQPPGQKPDELVDGASGDGPEDAASAALRAAREALASIQAEADAAAAGQPAPPPAPKPKQVASPAAEADDSDPQAAVDAAMQAAMDAVANETRATPPPASMPPPPAAKRLELPDFDLSSVEGVQHGLDMLADVQLDVRIELGRTRMLVEDVLRLNSGAVVELDKLAGDPLDVYVNDRLVARGEVLVLNDNFCIRINEIIDSVGEEVAQAAANG